MAGARAEVIIRVTTAAATSGLDSILEHEIRLGIEHQWPFDSVVSTGHHTTGEEFTKSLL